MQQCQGGRGRSAKAAYPYGHGMDKYCLGTLLWGTLETKTLNSSKSIGNKRRINARHRGSLNLLYHWGLCNGELCMRPAGPRSGCCISPCTCPPPLCSWTSSSSGLTIIWAFASRHFLINYQQPWKSTLSLQCSDLCRCSQHIICYRFSSTPIP